jgi:hypothetical protein
MLARSSAPLENWFLQVNPMQLNLLLQVFATIFMTGLIWFVHVVHYALYPRIGPTAWYERDHVSRTACVVAPVMTLEAITAVLLFPLRPAYVPEWSVWLGIALLAVIWLLSFLILVPQHFALVRSTEASEIHIVMKVNAIRTALWTARSVLVLWMLAGGVSASITR